MSVIVGCCFGGRCFGSGGALQSLTYAFEKRTSLIDISLEYFPRTPRVRQYLARNRELRELCFVLARLAKPGGTAARLGIA